VLYQLVPSRADAALEAALCDLEKLSLEALRFYAEERKAAKEKARLREERSAYTVDDILYLTGLKSRHVVGRFIRKTFPYWTEGRRLCFPKWAWDLWIQGRHEELRIARAKDDLDYEVPIARLADLWARRRGVFEK
jgi:hypothetical protein